MVWEGGIGLVLIVENMSPARAMTAAPGWCLDRHNAVHLQLASVWSRGLL